MRWTYIFRCTFGSSHHHPTLWYVPVLVLNLYETYKFKEKGEGVLVGVMASWQTCRCVWDFNCIRVACARCNLRIVRLWELWCVSQMSWHTTVSICRGTSRLYILTLREDTVVSEAVISRFQWVNSRGNVQIGSVRRGDCLDEVSVAPTRSAILYCRM